MRLRSISMLALLALAGTNDALATQYYYCYVRDYNGNELRYFSGILSTGGEIDEQATGFAYGEEIEPLMTRDYPGDASSTQSCNSSSNLATIKKAWADLTRNYPGPNPQQVPFTNPPVPSEPVVESTPGPYLTIEPVKPTGPTPQELAAQAQAQRQADAARAAERARAAAAAAREDAKWQAKLEKERERRRKCPACQ